MSLSTFNSPTLHPSETMAEAVEKHKAMPDLAEPPKIGASQPASTALTRRDFLKLAGMASGSAALAATQWGGLFGSGLAASAACGDNASAVPAPTELPDVISTLTKKDFSVLKDRVTGISWKQLSQHIGLYEGYVDKLNAANTTLKGGGEVADMRALQQKRSYSYNGAILHDWYFSNLGEDQPQMGTLTQKLLVRDFGSTQAYLDDLASVGKAMRGWVITGISLLDNRAYNFGLDAHDVGTPVWFHPLVVLDVYEHAYMIDFGTSKQPYLTAFQNSIRWGEVENRLKQALKLRHLLMS